MKQFRKLILSIVGGLLVALGLVFVILPGPSLLLLIPGLYLLSLEYDWAKVWLRKCQRMLKKSALWIDKQMRKRKHSNAY